MKSNHDSAQPERTAFCEAPRPILLLGMLLALALPGVVASAEPGKTIFTERFDTPSAADDWRGEPCLVDVGDSGKALSASRAESAGPGSTTYRRVLPIDSLEGCLLHVAARVRAEGVGEPPRPWNGVKVMAIIESSSGRQHPQADLPVGTFDWRDAAFSFRVPRDAQRVELVLGLEAVTGQAWFDDVLVTLLKRPPVYVKPPAGPTPWIELGRLRGAMIGPDVDEDDLRTLGAEWGANLVRWQLIYRGVGAGFQPTDLQYDRWLDQALARLDKMIPVCHKYGLNIIVDLHSPPGGRARHSYVGSNDRLFTDPAMQDKFVEIWRRITRLCKNRPGVIGFDLVNEPVPDLVTPGCDDWRSLAIRAAKAIRQIDPDRTIVYEPGPWGSPEGLSDCVPLPLANVVYSVHMYRPHTFTHQTLHNSPGGIEYPGKIDGRYWDKAALREELAPAIEFRERYGLPIYIGEFSAIRWAPAGSAARYLSDLIEIFESEGWHWSYHAFREFHGWSAEHGTDRDDRRPSVNPTEREQLLRKWFAKNL
ncbi:MAG: cellulase family glycosylhydrolase [Pirellulaceae bacterium]